MGGSELSLQGLGDGEERDVWVTGGEEGRGVIGLSMCAPKNAGKLCCLGVGAYEG